ncbi:MAG: phosphate acyltransferase PlsX [Candidatus Carbobacillus altaicus]|nr:phosphate acyltransferase PlsX [Candidatus Carbobacillus altaicus]
MRIGFDAMGGDHAPRAVIEGALFGLRQYADLTAVLFGAEDRLLETIRTLSDRERIRSYLDSGRLSIVHATDVILAEEEPVRAVRHKKESSLVKGVAALAAGELDAFVSAGSTGALVASGLFILGRMPGMDRPALAPMLPTLSGRGVLVLDVGANVDAKAQHLVQYALIGHLYARKMMDRAHPRVGLLNIGTEPGKGHLLAKSAYDLIYDLSQRDPSFQFVGNVEARDVMFDQADVVVTDGFTGNIFLKTTEGVALAISGMLKEALMSHVITKAGALLAAPGLKKLKTKLDYKAYGGTPLLGLKRPLIKAHGSSDAQAILAALRQAYGAVENNLIDVLSEALNSHDIFEKETSQE